MRAPKDNVWDQEAFRVFMAGRDPKQNSADARTIKRSLQLLSRLSPYLKAQLAWARAHGIEIFIDHTAVNCAAYYKSGRGVIGLVGDISPYAQTAGTLSHELRHAWQDYHGLLGAPYESAVDDYMRLALYEADAYASGELAAAEVRKKSFNRGVRAGAQRMAQKDPAARKRAEEVIRKSKIVPEEFLAHVFKAWFDSRYRTDYYGCRSLAGSAKDMGLAIDTKDTVKVEFKSDLLPTRRPRVQLDDMASVLQYGKVFNSKANYLSSPRMKDMLRRRGLSPTAAYAFYAEGRSAKKDFNILRKEELRRKLKKSKADPLFKRG